jgi:hypothetical protein
MARTLSRRGARGQALVELALGSIVMITVLIFAIHFAEIGYISLKVTEASHSALLDATGHRLHDWPDDESPSANAARIAGQKAMERYGDFDGRQRSTGGTTFTQAFTQATNMNVVCRGGGGPGWGPSFFTGLAYSDNGGITCRSEADLMAIRIPTDFLEDADDGFFQTRHYEPTPIHVCGIGRARGGGCRGELTSMLDDWGLSGPQESRMCPIIPDVPIPCLNDSYWQMAASVHLTTGLGLGWSGSSMAQGIVGALPFPFFFGGENMFWMSAMGEETLFVQPLPSEGWGIWPTTPGLVPGGLAGIPYTVSYVQRDSCFLGKECPP